jgi:hypothetical protein
MGLPSGHKVTADEYARNIPIKAVLLTNTAAIATTSGTTELDLSKYAMTGLSLTTGRYYMLRYNVTYTKTVAADTFDLKVRANTAVSGTQIGQSGINPTQGNAGADWTFEFMFKGDSSYTAIYFSIVRTGGTGTFTYYGAVPATPLLYRSWATLNDMGDTDNWSEVA